MDGLYGTTVAATVAPCGGGRCKCKSYGWLRAAYLSDPSVMKQTKPVDAPLRDAMRSWEVRDPLPPRFSEGVWRRASSSGEEPPRLWSPIEQWARSFAQVLVRPAWASAYVGTILLAAILLGHWQVQERDVALRNRQAQRYLQSLDPYQQARVSP